jgi:hypothetical protein
LSRHRRHRRLSFRRGRTDGVHISRQGDHHVAKTANRTPPDLGARATRAKVKQTGRALAPFLKSGMAGRRRHMASNRGPASRRVLAPSEHVTLGLGVPPTIARRAEPALYRPCRA